MNINKLNKALSIIYRIFIPTLLLTFFSFLLYIMIRSAHTQEMCESERQKQKLEYISWACSKIQWDVRDDRVIEYKWDRRVKLYSWEYK